MPAVSPGPSEPAADTDAGDRVRQLRPSSTPGAQAFDGASGGPELSGVALARRRESAARNATAAEHFAAGRHDEAVPLFEQALASCRSTLGSDHPDTLIVAGNLGVAYLAAGNRRKGIKLITGNLAARVACASATSTPRRSPPVTRSPSHTGSSATRTPLSNSAKQVAVQRSRTLGPVHVDTLTSRMGLALAMAAGGRHDHRARPRRVHDERRRAGSGADHGTRPGAHRVRGVQRPSPAGKV